MYPLAACSQAVAEADTVSRSGPPSVETTSRAPSSARPRNTAAPSQLRTSATWPAKSRQASMSPRRLDSARPAAYRECMRWPWARLRAQARLPSSVRPIGTTSSGSSAWSCASREAISSPYAVLAAQSAAATGAARRQDAPKPCPTDRLTATATMEWFTRKNATIPMTHTNHSDGLKPWSTTVVPNGRQWPASPSSTAVRDAAAAADSTYWSTLNSRLTACRSTRSWLAAMPTAVASTSSGMSMNTTPSTMTMSVTPTEKRWLRMGTLTTKRSAATRPAAYTSGCQSVRQSPPTSSRAATGRAAATTAAARQALEGSGVAVTAARPSGWEGSGCEGSGRWGSGREGVLAPGRAGPGGRGDWAGPGGGGHRTGPCGRGYWTRPRGGSLLAGPSGRGDDPGGPVGRGGGANGGGHDSSLALSWGGPGQRGGDGSAEDGILLCAGAVVQSGDGWNCNNSRRQDT